MTKEELEQAIAAARAGRAEMVSDRDAKLAEKDAIDERRVLLERQITDLQLQLDDATAEAENLTDIIASRNDEIAAADAEIARLQKELDDMATAGAPVGVSMGNWIVTDDTQRQKDIAEMKATGFTWIRHGINWSGSEPTAGNINTFTATKIGGYMKAAGMKWLVVLAYSPKFYSIKPDTDKAPPKPEHYDEWERWVEAQIRAVVAAIGVENCAFEIWNEQNHVAFWDRPDPKIYVALLKRAKRAAKKVNASVQVVFGGMAPAPDRVGTATVKPSYRSSTFVRKCYENGMTGADFDAMNFHPYNGIEPLSNTKGKPWDMNTTVYDEVVAEMTKHGDGAKKMWSTEFGYNTRSVAGQKKVVTEQQQADYLVEQIKYLRSKPTAGVSFVFCWREFGTDPSNYSNSLGINRHRSLGGGPKPAVAAIRKLLTGK